MTDPIEKLVTEGEKDSSGSFTLDLLAAQRKVAKMSEQEPGLMLGKLVQAAVVGRANRVHFGMHKGAIRGRITFPLAGTGRPEVQTHLASARD